MKKTSITILLLIGTLLIGIIGYRSARAGSDEFVYLPVVFSDNDNAIPPEPGTYELNDGGTITSTDGVLIGAVSGVLSDTLSVTIERDVSLAYTTSPTLTLTGGVTPHGNYYRLHADRAVFAPGTTTFILGLPVPTGVPTSTLGIALYEPPDGEDEAVWHILSGLYDADHKLMVVTLPHIATESRTAVLVSHPSLSSPLNPSPTTSIASENEVTATQFAVHCLIEDDIMREFCDLDKVLVEDELERFFGVLVSMGYPQPRIYVQAQAFDLEFPNVIDSTTYYVTIDTSTTTCNKDWLGFYSWRLMQLNFCIVPTAPLNDTYLRLIRHELFHAHQAAFPGAGSDFLNLTKEKWIIEGIATVAEESDGLNLVRTPWRDLRSVDRPLQSIENVDEYEVQDFWVFLGQASGTALDSYLPLFQQGAKTEDVVNWIGSESAFQNWYWRWVKNQVMVEENITFDNVLGQPCTFQNEAVDNLRPYDLYNEILPPATLPPLTSHVVKVIFAPELDGLSTIRGWVLNGQYMVDPDLKYKIYVNGETCSSIDDGERRLYNIASANEYYVVVSNVNLTEPKEYNVFFD